MQQRPNVYIRGVAAEQIREECAAHRRCAADNQLISRRHRDAAVNIHRASNKVRIFFMAFFLLLL